VSTLIEQLLNLPSPLALTMITVLVFGEAAVFVGFVLPGETAVLLGASSRQPATYPYWCSCPPW
jgi:membrane-associated protein